jgi:hypothetical protein
MTTPATGSSAFTKPGPAPFKMVPAEDAELDKQFTLESVSPVGPFQAVFFGPPGTGKTTAAATLPSPFRWIDADGGNGLKTLRWAQKAGLTTLKDLTAESLIAYKPAEEFEEGYVKDPKALDKMADMTNHWFKPTERDKWQTLVIDSITEVNMWCIYKGLHLNGQLPTHAKPLSKSDEINEKAKTMLLTGEQDYKSAQGLFIGWLTEVRLHCTKYEKNLICTAHEWRDEVEKEDGSMMVRSVAPWLIGQLRNRIAKDFDDVWYFQLFNGKEVKVQVQESPTVKAKTRWGQIVGPAEGPDYRVILEKVKKFHGIK